MTEALDMQPEFYVHTFWTFIYSQLRFNLTL